MATIATNDTKNKKPSAVQTATFKSRSRELRERFFAGVLDPEITNDGLQTLMEMTRGCINGNARPEIPSWARKERPIDQHLPCGMIDPSKFSATSVFQDGEEYLNGEEFITRAQKLDSMNACGFDFYSKSENWRYLPKDADVIVFPKTIFCDSGGDRCVRFLYHGGDRCVRFLYHGSAEWIQGRRWLNNGFRRSYRVAVSASSPQNSDPKLS